MTLSLPIPPGEQLSLLLSPKENRIYFENMRCNAPTYVQVAIDSQRHMMVVRRCTIRGKYAVMVESAEDGSGSLIKTGWHFMNMLYCHLNVNAKVSCRLKSVSAALNNSSAFLFDMSNAEACMPTAGSEISEGMMEYE